MIETKPEIVLTDLLEISPPLGIVFYDFCHYAKCFKQPVCITSIASDNIGFQRVSATHAEFRGIDARSRGWTSLHKRRVVKYLNSKYGESFGTSRTGKDRKVIILHGPTEHFHLQVMRGLDKTSDLGQYFYKY